MSGRPARKPKGPVEAFDANMPDHATMDAELVAAAESRPESPRENYTAVTTSAEGHGDVQRDLSGQQHVFPDVRLLRAGQSPLPGAFGIAIFDPDAPRAVWKCTDGREVYSVARIPSDAQRLIPIEPLLELAATWDLQLQVAALQGRKPEESRGEALVLSCLRDLRSVLASLLGTSPDSPAQEGDDG